MKLYDFLLILTILFAVTVQLFADEANAEINQSLQDEGEGGVYKQMEMPPPEKQAELKEIGMQLGKGFFPGL